MKEIISVDEFVNLTIKKGQEGVGDIDYVLPSNELILKPPLFAKMDKAKIVCKIEQIGKNNAWIPAPNKYVGTLNWDKNFPSKGYGKFLKRERYLLSDEIEK